ncbi:MAG: hypothetical protein FJ029_03315 [Actinobacteria bacterium]|nr:hypothetical protein [Actinomycetota bacterium]
MAFSFLTKAALQQVTQRVLEQLPAALTGASSGPRSPAPDELARWQAAALGELSATVQALEARQTEAEAHIRRIEARSAWPSLLRRTLLGLLIYAVGFATAIIAHTLGWFGR